MFKKLKVNKHKIQLIFILTFLVAAFALILWNNRLAASITEKVYRQGTLPRNVIDIYKQPTFKFVIGDSGPKLNQPMGVTTDTEGNIYVADSGNNQIKVFSPEGKYLRAFDNPSSQSKKSNYPYGLLFLDKDTLLVGDPNKLSVEKYDKNGVFLGDFISAKEGIKPGNLYKDSDGKVYVTDLAQNSVLIYDSRGNLLDLVESNDFNFLQGTAKDTEDNLIIANSGENKISFVNSVNGQLIREITGESKNRPSFSMIRGIAIDNFNRIIVTDTLINQLRFFSNKGEELFSISGVDASFENLNFPTTVFTSKDGEIFVVDRGNNRILVWTTNVN